MSVIREKMEQKDVWDFRAVVDIFWQIRSYKPMTNNKTYQK
jgi:hypothetical protein